MAAGMMFGSLMQAGGSLLQGQAQSTSLEAQADLNIKNAAEAETEGKINADKSEIGAGHRQGAAISAAGASGVTANSGSVQDILRMNAMNSERDRLNILHGADIKAIQYRNQASMERYGAKAADIGSKFGALGSVAKMAGMTNIWGSGAKADISTASMAKEGLGDNNTSGWQWE